MLTPDEIEDYAWRLTGGAEAVLESAVLEVLISEFVLVCGLDPGTVAFGLDRFVSIMAGLDSIRDCIAFPKNNSGRDVMLDAPGELDPKQLEELNLKIDLSQE